MSKIISLITRGMNKGSRRAADSPNVWGDETDNFFDFDISTVAAKPQESHKSDERTSLPLSLVFRYVYIN